jgi:SH3-like domain-containing protein
LNVPGDRRYGTSMLKCLIPIAITVAGVLATPAVAAEEGVPYWASIRASEVNMRVGPGEDYRINWVYRRPHLPVKVLRTMEGWRLVQDPDGTTGWMLARFLSRDRGGIVKGSGLAEMREKGGEAARVLWRLRPGVVGKLGDCKDAWCRVEVQGHIGFVRQDRVWGSGEP